MALGTGSDELRHAEVPEHTPRQPEDRRPLPALQGLLHQDPANQAPTDPAQPEALNLLQMQQPMKALTFGITPAQSWWC